MPESTSAGHVGFERSWVRAVWIFLGISAVVAVLLSLGRTKIHRERRSFERERAISASLRELAALKDELLADRTEQLAEREKLIGQMQTRNDELMRFNYTVSHDLKNPLVTIKNFVGLIKKDLKAGDHERVMRDLDRIDRSATRMQQMVAELLELSRIGQVVETPEDVLLGELVEEASELVAGALSEGGVELEVASDLPVVRGHPPGLLKVIQNLLDNAVKFMGSQPAPRITVGVSKDRGDPGAGIGVFFVRDNGVGIDSTYGARIFDLFERFAPEVEGTGIGLALVKRIIEVHDGRVWVESEGAGQGSTFYFTLPLAEVEESEEMDIVRDVG